MVEISPKIKKVIGILFVTVCVIALIIVLIRRKNKQKVSEDNPVVNNGDGQLVEEDEESEELDSDIKETYEEPKPADSKKEYADAS